MHIKIWKLIVDRVFHPEINSKGKPLVIPARNGPFYFIKKQSFIARKAFLCVIITIDSCDTVPLSERTQVDLLLSSKRFPNFYMF